MKSTSAVKTIAAIGEFELIQTFLSTDGSAGGDDAERGVVIGPGDDAAIVTVPRTQQLVTTTDTLVEGVHFRSDADPFLLGKKALAVNLSDLAAMAAEPRWYLLSLSLPPVTALPWAEELARGLREGAREYGITLIGGNVAGTRGCMVITLTAMGVVGKDRGLTRSAAQPGDLLMVSGTIGDAALSLAAAKGHVTVKDPDERIHIDQRHNTPEPRIALGVALRDAALARGCIDVSDGLVADLSHLCRASGVGARLDVDHVPFSPAVRNQISAHGPELLKRLIGGGEDYELLFTIAPGAAKSIPALVAELGVPLTEIGVITKDPAITIRYQGQPLTVDGGGWTHF